MRAPALLAILDGIGIAPDSPSNAVTRADAPFLHSLFSDQFWPCIKLQASGRAVGLPDGQMGNSEVGHLNIGAGRVVYQELTRIDQAIEDGSLANNPVLTQACRQLAATGGRLHLVGLCSNGGVHSTQSHMEALAEAAVSCGVQHIALHALLDGRDVSMNSGIGFVAQAIDFLQQLRSQNPDLQAGLATMSGRYWAMDRDQRWDRVQRAWQVMVEPGVAPEALELGQDPLKTIQASYDKQVFDEFVEPVAFDARGIVDGDLILFFNFRPDRARELTEAFINPDFTGFERPRLPKTTFLCMTEYDPRFAEHFGSQVIFPKSFPQNVLAEHLAHLSLRQLHIAETEKYAHVTFFFNGGIEEAYANEQRILVPSPKVATYDLQPEMSAPEVTAKLLAAIAEDAADVYIVNYANGDMVGHTGVQAAAQAAVETVDKCLEAVVQAILEAGGVALVTADHGNADVMQDEQGNVWTAHSLSPVPLVLVCPGIYDSLPQDGASGSQIAPAKLEGITASHSASDPQLRHLDLDHQAKGCLADIAPTLLDLMELPIPEEFSGRSLLVHKSSSLRA